MLGKTIILIAVISSALATSSKGWISKAKVNGAGTSYKARSPRECLDLCNQRPDCDAVNYHAVTHKCRLFAKCTPTVIVFNSTNHYYYSKRPQIQDKGYVYHPESDSCLKLVEQVSDFAGAEEICQSQKGRLVALTDPSINKHAASLLKGSSTQFAWIGLTDSKIEGDPIHTNGQRVTETGFFPVAPQGHRNDSLRNCWSLSDSGEWTEHACKKRQQFSICQIMSY